MVELERSVVGCIELEAELDVLFVELPLPLIAMSHKTRVERAT